MCESALGTAASSSLIADIVLYWGRGMSPMLGGMSPVLGGSIFIVLSLEVTVVSSQGGKA